jgi:lysophospholipase L1-like esterase
MKSSFKILIVFFSVIIIFSCAYFKSLKEGLTNNNTIILIGDSVLNNSNYVPEGKSVVSVLESKSKNIVNLAKDGATIMDLYSQLDNVPVELNKSSSYVFISVGGNDILKNNKENLRALSDKTMSFLDALRARLGSTKINMLNLYLPANPRYQSYKKSVDEWNQLLEERSNKIGAMYNVVDIHSLLTDPSDFVYDIEPSELGSKKIANAIYYVS